MRLYRIAVPLLFSAMTATPQTDPVIRVDVNLRQVDLIVTDAKGKHVSDLRREDFQLLEDGKPQPLTNFSWVEVTPPPSGARQAALEEKPSLLELYSGEPRFRKTPGNDVLASPVANLRPQEVRRVITIVAADKFAAKRIRKFIDEQAGPGDMLSVRSTGRVVVPIDNSGNARLRDAMGMFRQFTNDKRQLDAATEHLARSCWKQMCIADAPGELAAAIQSMQDLPGRKALLFVGRYRGPVDNIVRLANRAGVVIYVLDDMGVVYDAPTFDETVAPDSERLLAEKTGGRRILSTVGFDLTASFNEVIEDLSGYYLLGYRPAGDEPEAKTPVRHKIEVKVLRAGLTVRVRDGLMGAPDPAAGPASGAAGAPQGREEILSTTLFSPFTRDGIRIRLDPLFAAAPPNKKNKRAPIVRAVLDIDGRDVAFTDAEGGKKRTVIDVALAVFDEDGMQAGAANQAFTLLLSKEKAAQLGTGSLQYKLDVPLAKAGAYQVRAAVRDQSSGELGSSYAFLEIPDFNQPKIALSSVVLTLPQGVAALPGARPEWNEFAAGSTLQYLCEVAGLKTPGKPPALPNVDVEVKLYRGGGPVADIPAAAANVETLADLRLLRGSMRLPQDLAAGNYTMEVLAYDRREPSIKKQAAEQWIDVTVVDPARPGYTLTK